MSSRFCILIALLSACAEGKGGAGSTAQPGSRSADLDRIIDEVLQPRGLAEDTAAIYTVGEVSPGDALSPLLGEGTAPGALIPVEEPATLYLVDAAPEALWAHPALLVLVPLDGDPLQVEPVSWWPVLEGEPFLPWEHQPDWGLDPSDVETGARSAAAQIRQAQDGEPNPCHPHKPEYAVTIAGFNHPGVLGAEAAVAGALADQGYAVTRVAPHADPAQTRQRLVNALLDASARDDIGELVIYYVGHGAQDTGEWVLGGDDGGVSIVSPAEVAALMGFVDAERLTLLSDSCFAGNWEVLGGHLQTDEATLDVEVRVLASAGSGESAWTRGEATRFSLALLPALPAAQAGAPIDWDALDLGTLPSPAPGGLSQTPEQHFTEPRVPILEQMPHSETGQCLVAWIDSQDYDRRVMLHGRWFGESRGRVELQDPEGSWQPLPIVFWSDDGISLNIPMRREGFPSDSYSPDAEPPTQGHYALRVVRSDENPSRPEDHDMVHIALQHYVNTFEPEEDIEWNEMWHPYTPVSAWTAGPTRQLSRISLGVEPATDPAGLRLGDTDVPHEESIGLLGIPGWSYELVPGLRNLATAYDHRYPEFLYYGFRTGFSDSFSDTRAWRFEMAYD